MNKTFRIVLISIGTMLIVSYLLWSLLYFKKSNETICTQMKIMVTDSTLRQFISVSEITTLLKVNGVYPIGNQVNIISTEAIETVLSKHNMVKCVECYKTPQGNVNVTITQRIPKFCVMGNENYYVDTERNVMPTSSRYAAYVPIVTGRIGKRMACEEMFDFVTFLEKNDFWNAQIEQINVLENKKIELVPRVGSGVILLGTLDNYEQKLDKLRKLYVNGFSKMGWKTYSVIDLQYENQVVCRK